MAISKPNKCLQDLPQNDSRALILGSWSTGQSMFLDWVGLEPATSQSRGILQICYCFITELHSSVMSRFTSETIWMPFQSNRNGASYEFDHLINWSPPHSLKWMKQMREKFLFLFIFFKWMKQTREKFNVTIPDLTIVSKVQTNFVLWALNFCK